MLENGKINRYQLFLLLINFLLGSALIHIPSKVIGIAKQDVWISMLLLIVIGSLFIVLTSTLSKLYFGKTIIGINKEILGKKLGLIINLLYIMYFITLASILLREITDIIKVITLNETPIVVICIQVAVLVFFATYYGLEVIARSNEIYSILAFIGFFFTVLLLVPIMELDRLQPIIGNGFKPIVKGVFPLLGFTYGEMAIFFMIIPYVNNKKHLTKILIGSGVVASLTLLLLILSSILVLDINEAESSIFAPISIARLINIGDFFSRVEVVFNFTYFATVFIKLCLCFYAGVLAFSEVSKLSFYRPVIIPLLIIVISLSELLFSNIVEFLDFTSNSWLPYTLVFTFGIPIILLILTFVKKKKKPSR